MAREGLTARSSPFRVYNDETRIVGSTAVLHEGPLTAGRDDPASVEVLVHPGR